MSARDVALHRRQSSAENIAKTVFGLKDVGQNTKLDHTMRPEPHPQQQHPLRSSPVYNTQYGLDGAELSASSSSGDDSDVSDGAGQSSSALGGEEGDSLDDVNATTPTAGTNWKTHSTAPGRRSSRYPGFSRAYSMPLPSQLNHLQNPHRSSPAMPLSPLIPPSVPTPHGSPNFHELSVELADSVQAAIQTMLQVSPNQILDPTKEQFSACSLSIPTPSMSAMFTAMKNLNYISANMANFVSESSASEGPLQTPLLHQMHAPTDFDIGELLQTVGDSLGGTAAQVGADLVLYHTDVGLKHLGVRGDETGISYALSHVVRQVLNTAQKGDTVELGLHIQVQGQGSTEAPPSDTDEYVRRDSTSIDAESPLQCTVEIAHRVAVPEVDPSSDEPPLPVREEPTLSSIFLKRLLKQLGASISTEPLSGGAIGQLVRFSLVLSPGVAPPPTLWASDAPPDNRISNEPTMEELTQFIKQLKGKQVTLYASSRGSFAKHLSSYLTAWGMEVSHVSDDAAATLAESPSAKSSDKSTPQTSPDGTLPAHTSGLGRFSGTLPPLPLGDLKFIPPPKSNFIMIDDDIEILKNCLQTNRTAAPPIKSLRRPANPHRPRSTNHISSMRAVPQQQPQGPATIIHFTSLSNYKPIRDVIQSTLALFMGYCTPPEVLIIPKPAGPRRFLTALHTAVTKPVVDPFFLPTATSPASPGVHATPSFFQTIPGPVRSPHQRPSNSRSNSDRSERSPKDFIDHGIQLPPPSPLGHPDNVEYFPESTVPLGSTPSSGLLIQSPDGQPAGIFFHPQPRSRGSMPTPGGGGGFFSPTGERRNTNSRRPDTQLVQSFSVLQAASSPPKVFQAPLPIEPAAAARKLATGVNGSTVDHTKLQPQTSPTGTNRRPSPQETVPAKAGPPTETAPPPHPKKLPSRRSAEKTVTKHPALGKGKQVDDGIVPPVSVLIVEDNPINQAILAAYIKKKKIRYDTAKNGAEAVQKWKTGGFHIIFMDIQMPVMNGIDATKEIRRLESLNAQSGYPLGTPSIDGTRTPTGLDNTIGSSYRSSVIIVALTASSMESDRVAALAAGCNDFLTKPVALDWLNDKIIEWGSIKALQTWADMRHDVVRTMANGQVANAQKVASKLHVPPDRRTPSPAPHLRPSKLSPPPLTAPAQSLTDLNHLETSTPLTGTSPKDERPSLATPAQSEEAITTPLTLVPPGDKPPPDNAI